MVYIRKSILIVFILFGFLSCREKLFTSDVNCDECYFDEPDSVYITLNVTLNETYTEVPVLLYKGKSIENGEFIDTFYCYNMNGDRYDQAYVKADEYYSAKAIYTGSTKTIYVVNGIKNKLKRVTDACEDACWVSENDELKLKLVY